jgi:site-specific DNA-cytosine methylase
VAVYRQNFVDCSEHALVGDIGAVADDAIPAHDILTAGFPCQPFSSLGLQPGLREEKGVLFQQIVRVLRLRQPRAFLLENVPGLLQVRLPAWSVRWLPLGAGVCGSCGAFADECAPVLGCPRRHNDNMCAVTMPH